MLPIDILACKIVVLSFSLIIFLLVGNSIMYVHLAFATTLVTGIGSNLSTASFEVCRMMAAHRNNRKVEAFNEAAESGPCTSRDCDTHHFVANDVKDRNKKQAIP